MGKIETGIPSFDQISGGGLPFPSAISLLGNVGSVKEILARQITWNFLQKGCKVLYYSISQSAEDLKNDMNRFNWDVTQFEEEGLLYIEDIFTKTAQSMIENSNKKSTKKSGNDWPINSENYEKNSQKELYDLSLIPKAGMKFMPLISISSKPRIIIFDSLSPIIASNSDGILKMLHSLKFATRFTKSIGIGLLHTKIHDSKIEETIKSIADVIIEVNELPNGPSTITLPKFTGDYKKGPFPLEINNYGINIIPLVMPEFISWENKITP